MTCQRNPVRERARNCNAESVVRRPLIRWQLARFMVCDQPLDFLGLAQNLQVESIEFPSHLNNGLIELANHIVLMGQQRFDLRQTVNGILVYFRHRCANGDRSNKKSETQSVPIGEFFGQWLSVSHETQVSGIPGFEA